MMKTRMTAIVTIAPILTLALLGSPAVDAQMKEWVKDTVKRTASSEGRRQVDRGIRHAIRCAVGEYECYERAKQRGEEVVFVDDSGEVITDDQGNPVTDPANLPPQDPQNTAAPAAPATLNANFDFQPGERVILYEDYSTDVVGDFPRRLELVRGNWDIVERDGVRMLRNTGPRHSAVRIPLPESLPERFTIEFPVLLYPGNANLALSTSPPGQGADRQHRLFHYEHNYFDVGSWGTGLTSRDPNDPSASQRVGEALTTAPVPIRIMADGSHVKMYVGELRVANVPNADLDRADVLWIENTYAASQENPILIGPIRIAAGGRDLYDALAAEGRVAIHDILFDVDQATIKPQSAEVLTGIGTMLAEHPELALMIEGHTDSTGDFDHNMDLSQRRAESVRQWLVVNQGVAEDRLRSMGLGSTQPKESNDTEEGRRQNRRVELVKLRG